MQADPIVEEVRKIRFALEEECHFSFKEIFIRAKDVENRIQQDMIDKPVNAEQEEVVA